MADNLNYVDVIIFLEILVKDKLLRCDKSNARGGDSGSCGGYVKTFVGGWFMWYFILNMKKLFSSMYSVLDF